MNRLLPVNPPDSPQAVRLLVPDSRAARGRRADPVGQVPVIAMLGSLAYAIIQGPAYGWRSPEIAGFFVVSVTMLVILLTYEPRRPDPLIDFRFFRSIPFSASTASYDSGPLFLVVTYGLFGIGAGMVNSPITNGVMSGVLQSRAGVASGMNSSARQLGQSLGVAIVGSVLAASLHGSMEAGFLRAAHAGWWIMAGCGYALLVLGVISTTGWALATVAKAGGDS